MASSPRRRIDTSQDGFALIEVLISGLIAVLVAGAVMTLFAATERSAADSRKRSQAAAIAQEDQARLRTIRVTELTKTYKTTQSRTVTLDGTNFTVESSAKSINDKTGSDLTCGNTSVDYVQISTKVSWPGMRSGEAVTIKGLIAPPSGSLDPTKGTLVITAANAAGGPLAGIGVSGSGAGTFSGTTSTAGCVIFQEQTAGTYTMSISGVGTGLVDQDGATPAPKSIKVNKEVTTTVPLLYDKPGSVNVGFATRNYDGSIKSSEVPVSSFIVFNSGMTTAKLVGSAEGSTFTSKKVESLFPFTSPDAIWAGACSVNNPGSGPALASATITGGGTASATVRIPALWLTVKNSTGAANNAEVKVTDTQCETAGHGVRKTMSTNSSGQLKDPGLPWSTYNVCASVGYPAALPTLYYHKEAEVEVHSDTGNPATLTVTATDPAGKCP